jgi:Rieske Fe-S protein
MDEGEKDVKSNDGSIGGYSAPRRRFLRVLGGSAGGALMAQTLGLLGCSGAGPASEGPVVLDLAELPPGRRVIVSYRGLPVQVIRGDDGVHALSLTCTHMGCTVRWEPEQQIYFCPCHKGTFDADGKVISGPPPSPLPSVPVTVSGSVVTIGA